MSRIYFLFSANLNSVPQAKHLGLHSSPTHTANDHPQEIARIHYLQVDLYQALRRLLILAYKVSTRSKISFWAIPYEWRWASILSQPCSSIHTRILSNTMVIESRFLIRSFHQHEASDVLKMVWSVHNDERSSALFAQRSLLTRDICFNMWIATKKDDFPFSMIVWLSRLTKLLFIIRSSVKAASDKLIER